MKEMNFVVGLIGPFANVKVVNKQDRVEYSIINGFADDRQVRGTVGNYQRSMYEFDFSGYYSDRKEAITRLNNEIESTRESLAALEFALKVTKKKNWVRV